MPVSQVRRRQGFADALPGKVYFNEWAEYPLRWLQNLWPEAEADGRDIREVDDDLSIYDRVHLFAGIGGWEYALTLAGWPAGETVWTGSCPCQPFSRAGKFNGESGKDDERHLWPAMLELIERHRPPVVFGEQVAGKHGLGWFDGVRIDLAAIDYDCGMAVLPAACVGSPHKRDRIFWVADTEGSARDRPVVRGDARAYRRVAGEEWAAYRAYSCSDGAVRRVGGGVQPLDARIPGDLDRLLAYGNSIVPQVAAVFVRAYMEARRMV